jgi:hypothetical protein
LKIEKGSIILTVEKVVFGQPWGGLGDNLQYSNLPKLYHDSGKKFYVSAFNNVRNKNIRKFCWENNPYNFGTVYQKPNIGWKKWIDNNQAFEEIDDLNIIQKINLMHGFDKGLGYPTLNISKELSRSKVKYSYIVDLNAISTVPNEAGWEEINDVIKDRKLININYPSVKNLSPYPDYFNFDKQMNIISINDLVETLSKTETFVCLNSGSHTIAAGLKNLIGRPKNILSFFPGGKDISLPYGRFWFENIDYINIDGGQMNLVKERKLRIYEKVYSKYF